MEIEYHVQMETRCHSVNPLEKMVRPLCSCPMGDHLLYGQHQLIRADLGSSKQHNMAIQ